MYVTNHKPQHVLLSEFTSTVVNMTHPKEIMIDYLVKCQFATLNHTYPHVEGGGAFADVKDLPHTEILQ